MNKARNQELLGKLYMNKVLLKKQIIFQVILVIIFHLFNPLKSYFDSALIESIITLSPLILIFDVALKYEFKSKSYAIMDKLSIALLIFIIHHILTKDSYHQFSDSLLLNLIVLVIYILWFSSIPLLIYFNISYNKNYKVKSKKFNNPINSLNTYKSIKKD